MLNQPNPGRPDADLTLPSVVSALRRDEAARRLVFTIIFHPDTGRIGETAPLPTLADSQPWVLGRRCPAFSPGGNGPQAALQDDHISREALTLMAEGEQLLLRRKPGSSRCRIDGRELHDTVLLDRERLGRGVPILLGHSVVLLLRLCRVRQSREAANVIPELVGGSGYLADLREQVARLAQSGLDVLVRGETGTGKELVAAAIHRVSERGSGPMISVNMSAIPAGLAPATLFGSARGAYTGASRANEGYFNQAQGGTLFLDEIGDTPPEIQPQLLRALQEREIQAVGGAIRRVDVRVVSATDAALEGDGCDFKAALRHRLGAGEIRLLPLRQHPEDIGALLQHFLATSCRQAGRAALLPSEHSAAPEIAAWADLFHRFLRYDWPGNVRELANFASQVAVASQHELTLPDNIRQALEARVGGPAGGAVRAGLSPRRNMRDINDAEFDSALVAAAYEVAQVARRLGVSRQSVYRRMDESPRYRLAGQVPQQELERVLGQCRGDAAAAARDMRISVSGLRARLRDTSLVWH